MLVLTERAVQAVKGVVASSEEIPESGGLRVAAGHGGVPTSLTLSVVSLPGEDDDVIEEQGARLFLDPEASSLLTDKVLDAKITQNQVEFTLAERAA